MIPSDSINESSFRSNFRVYLRRCSKSHLSSKFDDLSVKDIYLFIFASFYLFKLSIHQRIYLLIYQIIVKFKDIATKTRNQIRH